MEYAILLDVLLDIVIHGLAQTGLFALVGAALTLRRKPWNPLSRSP